LAIGLNLIPFAGIAFLWFIGVIRDRIGVHEDRFFATVFLGSGLAALVFVFWGQPTAAVVIVIAVLLLVVLGLIELIGSRPSAQPEVAARP
jgi:hypothetical protein